MSQANNPTQWTAASARTLPLACTHWYEQIYEDHSFVLYRIRW